MSGVPVAPVTARPEPRRRLWPPIVVLAVGAVLAGVGVVSGLLVGFGPAFDAPVHGAPVTVTLHCDVGDYIVYQATGSGTFPSGNPAGTELAPGQVEVTGPDGSAVGTGPVNGTESITRGTLVLVGVVGFHAGTAGTYQVRITPEAPTRVVVAPSFGAMFLRALPWLALAGIGGLAVLGGGAWLIVAVVGRRRTPQADDWAGYPAPAGYPAVPPGPWLPRNYDPFPAPHPPPGAPPTSPPPAPPTAPPPPAG
jgi:hypothetical protein